MADEIFEIGIAVSGEGSGAKAFENLKLREMETKEEAKKLAAALDDLKRSGTATDQQLEAAARALIRAKAQAQQYGTEARRVVAAEQARARAHAQAGQAAQAQGAIVQRAGAAQTQTLTGLGRSWGQVSTALGATSQVIGRVSPEFGQLGSILSGVGAASTGLTGAMGPLGLAIAGVTTVIGLAGAAWSMYESSTRQAETATRSATTSIEAAAVARSQDALTRAQVERDRLRTQGTNAEFADAERWVREMEGSLARAQAPARARADLARQTEDSERRRVALQEQGAQFEERNARALAEVNAQMADIPERRGGGAGRAAAARREAERDAEREEERLREQSMRAKEAANAVVLNEEAAAREINRQREAVARFGIDQNNAYIEAQLDGLDRVARHEREVAEARRQHATEQAEAATRQQRELGQITGDMWNGIGGTVVDAAGEMAKFVISGAEGGADAFLAMLDSFLEATAIQYTIKAIAEVAEGVASAARQDYPSAGQHFAAAAMAGAVAAATGLASAAIPNAPSGAGAGGGLQPAAPQSGGGGTSFNVSIYAPNAILTERERASMITESLRVARREGGSGDIRL